MFLTEKSHSLGIDIDLILSRMKNNLPLKEILSLELLLQFYKDEIADLLTKLSKALDKSKETSFISVAEYFLNELVIKDESVSEMRSEARELQRLMKLTLQAGIQLNNQSLKNLQGFSKRIKLFGRSFSDLRDEFHQAFPSNSYDQKAA